MQRKSLYVVVLFQMLALCGSAQHLGNVFEGEDGKNEGVTMTVDRDVAAGKSAEAAQDSVLLFNEKWELYLSGKNSEIEQLFNDIQAMDPASVTKEIIGDYTVLAENLKDEVNFKLSHSDLWKDNDELDKLRTSFFATQNRAVLKLQQLEAKIGQKKEKTNPLVIVGMCLLAVMAVVPIFTQIKSSMAVKKAKKIQEKLAKSQQEELERQMLLSDAKNEIILKT